MLQYLGLQGLPQLMCLSISVLVHVKVVLERGNDTVINEIIQLHVSQRTYGTFMHVTGLL